MHFMSLLYTHGEIKEKSVAFTKMGCWHIYHSGIQEWLFVCCILSLLFEYDVVFYSLHVFPLVM